jgi:hypothetical protein
MKSTMKKKRVKVFNPFRTPPLSPCSRGCLPCNIYCFMKVIEETRRQREIYLADSEK